MTDWQYKPAADSGLPPLKRWKSEKREPGLVAYLSHRTAAGALRLYLRTYHRLKVEGVENLPATTPFILAANHASHFDALVMAACLPRRLRGVTFPIAAGDVFFETPPVAAFAAAIVNALPMWRKRVGRHALDDLKNRLREGSCAYILFPEGARSRDGNPLAFKPGIGMMTAGSAVPVVPCRLWGCFEALPPGKMLPRPCKIRLKIGTPLDFAAEPDRREGWERVAEAVRAGVMGLE